MKKIFLIIYFIFTVLNLKSQTKVFLNYDIGGTTSYNYYLGESSNHFQKIITNYKFGIELDKKVFSFIYLSSNFNISKTGFTVPDTTLHGDFSNNYLYLDLPIILKIKLSKMFYLTGGIINKFYILNFAKPDNLPLIIKRSTDFNMNYVLDLKLGFDINISKKIVLSAYYFKDLTAMYNLFDSKQKNLGFLFSIKYNIFESNKIKNEK